jgi:hypothetical protein
VCIRYRGNVSSELLPSNDRGIFTEPLLSNDKEINIQTQTDWSDSFNYAVEMGSGAVMYVPSFIKIGSGIQKLIGGVHRQQSDFISLRFLNK